MPIDVFEIIRCPAELRAEALAIVLCDLAPSQRREVAQPLLEVDNSTEIANEPLFIARRGDLLRGAAWGQRQPGNVAVFWPPQLVSGEEPRTAFPLAEAVVHELDAAAIDLTQSLLPDPDPPTISVLRHVGFRHLADLLYLTCESERFPLAAPEPSEIEFEQYVGAQRGRLLRLIERTYEGTLDCTALNGARDIDDVVAGYQATGVFRAENWLFVRCGGQDVGVLLLADHPQARHWELMYMGLVPEFRGRGWGRQITHYAQWLGRGARIERVLVAVDAANKPAVDAYRGTGFEIWERRAVYLRFPANSPA
jgi:ribosomal protein S18 acetylase RimI-like enzyme